MPAGGEELGDLAVRQAGVLVQVGDGRVGVGSELAGGGPQGVGGLKRVSGLNAFAAAMAVADVQVEATDDRPAGNLGLVLSGGEVLGGRTAAVRAGVGQRHVDDLIGRPSGDRAMGLGPVVAAAR